MTIFLICAKEHRTPVQVATHAVISVENVYINDTVCEECGGDIERYETSKTPRKVVHEF